MDIGNPGYWWIAAAALLAGVELLVPGVFLVFLAFAAAVTGLFTLLFPDLPFAGQAISFVAWSAVSVWIGRRWYQDDPDPADPLLNQPSQRLIGRQVRVVSPIGADGGRVRLGDGEWPARGPSLPVDTLARIVAVDEGWLVLEPIALPELPE
ncbi:NfeD family protein [Sphingomonas sp.]